MKYCEATKAVKIAKDLNHQAIIYKKQGNIGFYETAIKKRDTWINIARSYLEQKEEE